MVKQYGGHNANDNAPAERLSRKATRVFSPDVQEKQELSKRNARDCCQDVSTYGAKHTPQFHFTFSVSARRSSLMNRRLRRQTFKILAIRRYPNVLVLAIWVEALEPTLVGINYCWRSVRDRVFSTARTIHIPSSFLPPVRVQRRTLRPAAAFHCRAAFQTTNAATPITTKPVNGLFCCTISRNPTTASKVPYIVFETGFVR